MRIGKFVLIPENIAAAETEFIIDREQTSVTIHYIMNDETIQLTQFTVKKTEAEKWMGLVEECIKDCARKREEQDHDE